MLPDLPDETDLPPLRDACGVTPAIRRAVAHIEAHFAEPLPIARLAALSGLSLHRFVTVFRSQVGIPPHQYLCRVRVRHARALLWLGLPAAEVALDTGFCDQSHLTRHFKRQCGTTPGSFAAQRPLQGALPQNLPRTMPEL